MFVRNWPVRCVGRRLLSVEGSLVQTPSEAAVEGPKLPLKERIKTAPKRAVATIKKYFTQLGIDYKRSVVDFGKEMKDHPFKAAGYIGLCALGYHLCKTAPDEQNLYGQVVRYSDELGLLSKHNRNSQANEHIRMMMTAFDAGEIRHAWLGIFSLVWLDTHGKDVDAYPARCRYTTIGRTGIFKRIIDVGIANHWLMLKYKMANYDVAQEDLDEYAKSQSFFEKLWSFR